MPASRSIALTCKVEDTRDTTWRRRGSNPGVSPVFSHDRKVEAAWTDFKAEDLRSLHGKKASSTSLHSQRLTEMTYGHKDALDKP